MTRTRTATTGSILLLLSAVAALANLPENALERDSAYRWQIQQTGPRAVIAELVSQRWRDSPWRHSLRVTRPATIRHPDVAVLIVGGDGRNEFVDEQALAEAAGVVVGRVANVPNQPLYGQREDALIAYTFAQFLRTRDPEWPLLLPMTRAVLRAIDAVGEIAAQQWQVSPRRFVVSGASKRGWATWLAGATDPRIAGIVPIVFDNLNFSPQMKNQQAVWSAYSPEIGDYSERSLPSLTDTASGRELIALVDPYSYLNRLEPVAKLVVNGSNDPYWELGAVNFYWNDLRGPKSLLEIPNAGHGAGGDGRVGPTIATFVDRLASGKRMPELRWSGGERDAALKSDEAPASAAVWIAQSPSRDFRRASWQPIVARREGDRWISDVPAAAEQFVAMFGEAQYAGPAGTFSLSTPVRILAPEKRGDAQRDNRSSAAISSAPFAAASTSSQAAR